MDLQDLTAAPACVSPAAPRAAATWGFGTRCKHESHTPGMEMSARGLFRAGKRLAKKGTWYTRCNITRGWCWVPRGLGAGGRWGYGSSMRRVQPMLTLSMPLQGASP